MWRTTANILEKHSRRASKGWSSSLGFGDVLTTTCSCSCFCCCCCCSSSSSSSIDTTAHCGLRPVEKCPSIFSYLPPTLSIFSLPALEDLFLLPLSVISWVFPFFSSLPVLQWRSFWAPYPPPFSPGDLTSLSFALLSILLYFLLCSSLLVLDSSDFSIPRFHI